MFLFCLMHVGEPLVTSSYKKEATYLHYLVFVRMKREGKIFLRERCALCLFGGLAFVRFDSVTTSTESCSDIMQGQILPPQYEFWYLVKRSCLFMMANESQQRSFLGEFWPHGKTSYIVGLEKEDAFFVSCKICVRTCGGGYHRSQVQGWVLTPRYHVQGG